MLDFACPACGHTLKVNDELAGRKGKCPRCGHTSVITAPAAASAQVGQPNRPLPTAATEEATVPPKEAAGDAWRETHSDDATGAPPGNRPANELTDFLAPPQASDEIGRLGQYRVLKILGHGGMGVVFLAEDPGLKRRVALKAMLPRLAVSASARERFLREARSAAAVEHDHIVTVYQVGEDRGVPFLAMPFLRGEPLDERLKREKRLPTAEVLRIARETAVGLEAARQRGMIHRDIKPANLWLEDGTGRVKILDFGLARSADDEGGLTQQGAILGTPAYMAPEQAGGKADHRSDLFSLGCVMYRMATGEPAFKGSDYISTLMAVATAPVRPPLELNPGLPVAASELILRLLAKKPEARPASAQAVVEAIRTMEAAPKKSSSGPVRTKPAAAPGKSGPQRLGAVAARPKAPAAVGARAPARVAAGSLELTPVEKAPPRRRRGAALWFALVGLVVLGGLAVAGYELWPQLSSLMHTPNTEQSGGTGPAAATEAAGEWEHLFGGEGLGGWVGHNGKKDAFHVDPASGVIRMNGTYKNWLLTDKSYGDFELSLEFKMTKNTNSGVALRVPPLQRGDPSYSGLEIQIIDEFNNKLPAMELTGSIWDVAAPTLRKGKPPPVSLDTWHTMEIKAEGPKITVRLDDEPALNADISQSQFKAKAVEHTGINRRRGRIGLQSETSVCEFKNIYVRPLPSDKDVKD